MKEKVTFSIDEQIMEQARETIPNMSQFIENCFKTYITLNSIGEESRGKQLKEAWDTLHESQLKIHILTSYDFEKQKQEKVEEKLKTDAWLKVWSDYRKTGTAQTYKLQESGEILEITPEELKQVLQDTYMEAKADMTKLDIYDDWEHIKKEILPYIEDDNDELEDELNEIFS